MLFILFLPSLTFSRIYRVKELKSWNISNSVYSGTISEDGNIILASTSSTSDDISLNLYSENSDKIINDKFSGSEPSITGLPDGKIIVVFSEGTIQYRIYDKNLKLEKTLQLEVGVDPHIDSFIDGFVIVWYDNDSIQLRTFDNKGLLKNSKKLNITCSCIPKISTIEDGDLILIWSCSGNVYGQMLDHSLKLKRKQKIFSKHSISKNIDVTTLSSTEEFIISYQSGDSFHADEYKVEGTEKLISLNTIGLNIGSILKGWLYIIAGKNKYDIYSSNGKKQLSGEYDDNQKNSKVIYASLPTDKKASLKIFSIVTNNKLFLNRIDDITGIIIVVIVVPSLFLISLIIIAVIRKKKKSKKFDSLDYETLQPELSITDSDDL